MMKLGSAKWTGRASALFQTEVESHESAPLEQQSDPGSTSSRGGEPRSSKQ